MKRSLKSIVPICLVLMMALLVIVVIVCYKRPHEHTYGDASVFKAATCTEDGILRQECGECDESAEGHFKDTPIPKLNHKWDNGTETKAATYLNKGEKSFKCLNDETHTKTEPIDALGIPTEFQGEWFSPDKANKLVIAETSIEFYQGEAKLEITKADGKNNELTFLHKDVIYKVTAGDNELFVNGVVYVINPNAEIEAPVINELPAVFEGVWQTKKDDLPRIKLLIRDKSISLWKDGVQKRLINVEYGKSDEANQTSGKITFGVEGTSYKLAFSTKTKEGGTVEKFDKLILTDDLHTTELLLINPIFWGEWNTSLDRKSDEFMSGNNNLVIDRYGATFKFQIFDSADNERLNEISYDDAHIYFSSQGVSYKLCFTSDTTVLKMFWDNQNVASDEPILEFYKDGTKEKPLFFEKFAGTRDITLNVSFESQRNDLYFEYTSKETEIYEVFYTPDDGLRFSVFEKGNIVDAVAIWSSLDESYLFRLEAGKSYWICFGSRELNSANTKIRFTVTEVGLTIADEYLGEWQTRDYDKTAGSKIKISADGIEITVLIFGNVEYKNAKADLSKIELGERGRGYKFDFTTNGKVYNVSVIALTDKVGGNVPQLSLAITAEELETVTLKLYHSDRMPVYPLGSEENPEKLTQDLFAKTYNVTFTDMPLRVYELTTVKDQAYIVTTEIDYLSFEIKGVKLFTSSATSKTEIFELEANRTYTVLVTDKDATDTEARDVSFAIAECGNSKATVIPEEIRNKNWKGSKPISFTEDSFTTSIDIISNVRFDVINITRDADGNTVIKSTFQSQIYYLIYDPVEKTLKLTDIFEEELLSWTVDSGNEK